MAATIESEGNGVPRQVVAPSAGNGLLASFADDAKAGFASLVPQGAQASNAIVLENLKPGNPIGEWGLAGLGDSNIQGFAAKISVNQGEAIDFKIATDSTKYRIDIYRLGYYGGDGARKVGSIEKNLATAQVQPHPTVDYDIGLIDCGNWAVSASWTPPADATSGVYIAKLVREDGTAGENQIPFVVRNDAQASDITFQTSDTTWQAYNAWGGASFYGGSVPTDPNDMMAYMPPNCSCGLKAIGRAYAVSYNRPYITTTRVFASGPQDYLFGEDYPALRWLEQNGYDVNYISGVDTARSAGQLLNSKVFLSVGHDEYWSGDQRANVEAARDAGVSLAFWGGNDVYWKTRWETSIDGSGTPYRTLVCYKETWANAAIDPNGSTSTWRDPRFADPGQKPENALTGTMFSVDSYRLDTITIPYDYSKLRFWRNTDVANLQPGQTYSLTKNLLGYEWNSDIDNGFRPAGLVDLSLSTVSVDTKLLDYGSSVGPGTASHSLTMYRAQSGAIVFSAGTVYWSWGLDEHHDNEATPTDPNVQQAMVNMFADMGVQPETLQASLVAASATTDHAAPTSTIAPFAGGNTFYEGQHVTFSGTASDSGGGLVAGVEISLDNGTTWHKASGRNAWTYGWTVQASGSYALLSRAVDDSLNVETPASGRAYSVVAPPTKSLWTFADRPVRDSAADRNSVELGMKFSAAQAGTISGINFYKGINNAGPHSVSLWTDTGQLLATGVSGDETVSGWQSVSFSSPVAIAAGTTYVASYHTSGFYAADTGFFTTPRTVGPLTTPANAGVFTYGSQTIFPGEASGNLNYWVDVSYAPATGNLAPVAQDDGGFTTPVGTAKTLAASLLLANDTDADGDPLVVTGVSGATNGTVSYDAQQKTVTFTPAAGYAGAAGFTYAISDGRGGVGSARVALVIGDGPPPPAGLFADTQVPTLASANDGAPVELGLRFTAAAAGTITGVQFYKGAQNGGIHTGTLWSSAGAVLATGTFTNETATGWQTLLFQNPVAIAAGATYTASYHAPSGHYAADGAYFATPRAVGQLSAPAAGNGVYAYGGGNVAPTSSYNATNYWVDVLYNPSGPAAPNVAPVANADSGFTTSRDAPLVIAASALLANDTDADGDTLAITGVSGGSHGTASYDAAARTVTFAPAAGYTGAAGFTYAIADGRGGTASATASLTVTAPPAGAQSFFAPGATPAIVAVNDNSSVELGLRFQADVAGTISAIRYYRGAGDVGPHRVDLWSANGVLLASQTATAETASGWQTVPLSTPAAIAANTTYVASYRSNGQYTATGNFFTGDLDAGHLHATTAISPNGSGVYSYGTTPEMPTSTYNKTNYYVDVVFNPQLAA